MWRADTVTEMKLSEVRSNGYSFQVELKYQAVRAGCTGVEVPIHFEDRQIGASKMTVAVQFESAVLPWRLRLGSSRGRRR
jgi:dolichol-phosphate mannosyltransferase